MTLCAQFESFRLPVVIISTIPLSVFGALLALYLVNGSANVYTNIGFVTLIGLISKHGIMMVEFANNLQESGKSRLNAIIEAASIRLKPILMTTLSMVFGALPLALSTGAGAVSRSQIGWLLSGA